MIAKLRMQHISKAIYNNLASYSIVVTAERIKRSVDSLENSLRSSFGCLTLVQVIFYCQCCDSLNDDFGVATRSSINCRQMLESRELT
jgi:hypothetical protein